jgi:hypothetical protein
MPERVIYAGIGMLLAGAAMDAFGVAWLGMILACSGAAFWMVDKDRESR